MKPDYRQMREDFLSEYASKREYLSGTEFDRLYNSHNSNTAPGKNPLDEYEYDPQKDAYLNVARLKLKIQRFCNISPWQTSEHCKTFSRS